MPETSRESFLAAVGEGRTMPVRRRIPADLETPVSAYLRLAGADDPACRATFLLESVEQGIQVGRYSFIGIAPSTTITLEGDSVTIARGDGANTLSLDGYDPLSFVRDELERMPRVDGYDLPGPFAGAVGYIGYDVVRHFERVPQAERAGLGLPDGRFVVPTALVVFDHVRSEIEIVVLPDLEGNADAGSAYDAAAARIDGILAALERPLDLHRVRERVAHGPEPTSNMSRERFESIVERAREYILAGDAFQIVLSQRFEGETQVAPFQIYRALRILNPSPYMFSLDFGDFQLIGSSPEVLVRLDGRTATLSPIAGTRARGDSPADDRRLEEELLADEKERAEHVMLVDLGRNDLGRVCETGSVHVDSLMHVERYSHVMHIVSTVRGTLREGLDGFDLLRACFPAGTVSGAPKIRAMQRIAELEGERRGPYAGAVGYFGRDGDMDMCITIRTIVMIGSRYTVQAGAGIVADSVPAREYEETVNKARALVRAVTIAEEGL